MMESLKEEQCSEALLLNSYNSEKIKSACRSFFLKKQILNITLRVSIEEQIDVLFCVRALFVE